MSINNNDLFPLGRNGQAYKIEVQDLTNHQKQTFVEVDGDTMSGPLKLIPPISGEDGTNKTYVDTAISKLQQELEEIVERRIEGSYTNKPSGGNGSVPRGPGESEFYFCKQLGFIFDGPYEEVDLISISHTSIGGAINNLQDIKVGEYLQFNIAGTADSITFIADAINHQSDYTNFEVVFNRKSSASVVSSCRG